MLIWFALLIPAITGIVLYYNFKRETLWWEFTVPFIVSLLLCFVSKALIEKTQTNDTEFWSGCAVKASYYEAWDERTPCSHPRYITDAKGRQQFVGMMHVYDVVYHSPCWKVTDSNRLEVDIDRVAFDKLCNRFENRRFVDLHRNYHTVNGNLYVTDWSGSDTTLEPVITTHTYENRIQASTSVFKFAAVNPKTSGLFEYPPIREYYKQKSILGDGGVTQPKAEILLQKYNAKIGRTKQVRLFIVVFRDKPIQAGLEQQNYWQGGNKNEFVITVGIDKDDNITWCHPFSWTEVEALKIEVRDYVVKQKHLDLEDLVQWLSPQIQSKFQRKHFKDFSYLTVEPPMWAVCLTFLITCLVNAGVTFWIIRNSHRENQWSL